MTLENALSKLKERRNEMMYRHNQKNGAGDNQFGVKMGDIRALAKQIKKNHSLALELWQSGNLDAQLLAILIMDIKSLSPADVDTMVRSIKHVAVADWFNAYVVKEYAEKESLRVQWMQSGDKMSARAGWSLTSGRVARDPEGLDLDALLDRIEKEMPAAPPEVQWTMNSTLAQIGIQSAKHRKRALAIGENLGIFKDYPVSRGCTSPYAPIWINEMVKRQNDH